MKINTDTLVSITEANQNFSKVAKLVDEKGSALILKNNSPKYLIIDFNRVNSYELSSNDDVEELSRKFLECNMEAYKELAK